MDTKQQILKYVGDHPATSNKDVATAMGISVSMASRYLRELRSNGDVYSKRQRGETGRPKSLWSVVPK